MKNEDEKQRMSFTSKQADDSFNGEAREGDCTVRTVGQMRWFGIEGSEKREREK